MNTSNFNTKRAFLFVLIFLCFIASHAQPTVFSWNDRHRGYDYISDAKNQKEQGPCGIFASVAAVEAMVQIYFNTTGSELDLSESIIYSVCGIDQEELSAPSALGFIRDNGVVDNNTMEFPDNPYHNPPFAYYRPEGECDYESYQIKAKIPAYGYSYEGNPTLTIAYNIDLKKAIMDYGPIIVLGNGADQTGNKLGRALHPGGDNVNHTVLVTGWNSNSWEIKDSWPGDISHQRLVEIDFFAYDPHFYCIYPVYNDNGLKYINVKDSYGTDLYTQAAAVDEDKDGFFRWGLDAYPPSGWTGYDKMDFDDDNKYIIFRDGYDPLPGPYISDTTSKYVCTSGRTFTLNNFNRLSDLGFSVSWSVTPSYYFNSSSSGNTATAVVTPNPSYVGKECKIEYTLNYSSTIINTYKFKFIINGPREELVSISVFDSYGGSPAKYGDTYYLCPYTTYMIYYNNYDYNCTTSDFDWVLPYSWTEYWRSNHYISINTNDWPDGFLEIWAKTNCCSPYSRVKVFTQYFGAAECGGYFMAFPNPSSDFVDIDVIKEKISSEELTSDIKTSLSIIDKVGTVKFKTEFKGFPLRVNTSDLPDGLYFINIQFKDKKSTIRLAIKH